MGGFNICSPPPVEKTVQGLGRASMGAGAAAQGFCGEGRRREVRQDQGPAGTVFFGGPCGSWVEFPRFRRSWVGRIFIAGGFRVCCELSS